MKRDNKTGSKGKMTVMIFQLEGDDSTLQEGFRTISTALNNVISPRATVRALPASATATTETQSISDSDVSEELEPDVEPLRTEPSQPSARRSKFKSPEVLDLDLTTGDVPLKSLLEPHADKSIKTRYLLTAYWLLKHRAIKDVSPDHIHTCFRHMGAGWRTPKNAGQALREMKSREQWFHKGDERGTYKLNHVGESTAEQILAGGKDD
jgi:hypothetical protein